MNKVSKSSAQWLEKAQQQSDRIDIDLLSRACLFTEKLNDKTLPRFSDSALEQGLAIAQELLALNADNETLATAISYPAVYYGVVDRQSIEKQLGKNVYKMLINAQRITLKQPLLQVASQKKADNLRKMLLAIIDDVRIVFIKLAECLVILKYLYQHDIPERKAIAQQTLDIYAPLANRLGIGQLKWQLEDLSFLFLNKEKYIEIKKALKMHHRDREQYIIRGIDELKKLLKKYCIKKISIHGRAKHIFSIYQKMKEKRLSFEKLYDSLAFRILLPTVEDCYTVLGSVHSKWPPIQTEFNDYIAKPKSNGYQSIHTTVNGPNQLNIEIQIRTDQMHNDAEFGPSAHWKYKEKNKYNHYEEKIHRLRKIMQWKKEKNESTTNENLYSKVFEDRVYVFTPNGDVLDLASGATPLDFAYCLHSEIGHRCRGAKVNGTLVPLIYKLNTGDCVDIIKSKESKPSRDWLNVNAAYLMTDQARKKAHRWFKKADFKHNLEKGYTIFEKYYRRSGLKKSDINKAYQYFNFKTSDDLIAALGRNDIGMVTILNYLKNKEPSATEKSDALTIEKMINKKQIAIEKATKSSLVIEGINNVLTGIAKCCRPIPGDSILGYVTKGHGVTIHYENCHNIQQAIKYRSERVLAVQWGRGKTEAYPVNIAIEASDRSGLLRDITAVITHEKISIVSVQSHVDMLKDHSKINFTVKIKNLEFLNKLLSQLRNIAAVIAARRV